MNCKFLSQTHTRCRQNRYPINSNNVFNIELCEQHLNLISKDHLTQYYMNLNTSNENYNTFSEDIKNRFVCDISHIQLQQYRDIYLIEHQLLDENNSFYKIKITQSSYIFLIQKNINSNIYSFTRRNLINEYNTRNYISPTLNQFIHSNTQLPNQRTIYDNENIIEILNCNICGYQMEVNDIKLGIKLKCCNQNNEICLECILHLLYTEYNKYNHIKDIKNYHILNKDVNCPYCRKTNNFNNLKNNNEFKRIFKNILNDKLQDYYKELIQTQLNILD